MTVLGSVASDRCIEPVSEKLVKQLKLVNRMTSVATVCSASQV